VFWLFSEPGVAVFRALTTKYIFSTRYSNTEDWSCFGNLSDKITD